MISFNIHNVEDIKVEKTGKVFEGSYCRKIIIKTSEVDMVEIYLFASTPERLRVALTGKGK